MAAIDVMAAMAAMASMSAMASMAAIEAAMAVMAAMAAIDAAMAVMASLILCVPRCQCTAIDPTLRVTGLLPTQKRTVSTCPMAVKRRRNFTILPFSLNRSVEFMSYDVHVFVCVRSIT